MSTGITRGALAGGQEARTLGQRGAAPDVITLALQVTGATMVDSGETDEGLSLLDDAMVTLRLDADVERYPSPREMVRTEVASTPLGDVFRDLAPETVEAVIASTGRRLVRHVDDGVAFPAEAYVVTATR